MLTTSLVSSLIMLDSNIVAVSLPTIARSLGATFTDIQWVVSAYVLTYAALLLAAGHYADLRGRRRAMLGGLMVFAVSSAVCGAATTPASTSHGLSLTLGTSDFSATIEETFVNLRALSGATDLPVNADFQSGFASDAAGVAANAKRAADAGVYGLSTEDRAGGRTVGSR